MSPDIDSLPRSSSDQRNILNHQAIEDYLKTIYALEQEERPVSTSRIAQARSVKPGSATSMIQRLDRLNLVNYEKHYGATLTEAGKQLALEVIRHHRLVELYLIEALGFGWDEVHEQADILEHVISEELEEKIAAALNYPSFDPHGDPIPSREGLMVQVETLALADLPENTAAVVSRVPDNADGDFLRYIAELGLVPGNELFIIEAAPFDGPLTVEINGKIQVVGHKTAATIRVEILQTAKRNGV
jgi:DtxR family Mn-dependent transcriptional regulator